MAQPIATPEAMRRAIRELLMAGTWPTVSLVRKQIGGGGLTVITEMLGEWRRDALAKLARMEDPDQAPAGVPPEVFEAGSIMWEKALATARREVASGKKARR